MLTPPDGEGAVRPDGPSVPSPQREDRANALFHSLAPVVGVDAARRLTDRLGRLQALVREAEDDAIRLTANHCLQVESLGRIDPLLEERAR
jgi:hypothetical protein